MQYKEKLLSKSIDGNEIGIQDFISVFYNLKNIRLKVGWIAYLERKEIKEKNFCILKLLLLMYFTIYENLLENNKYWRID